MFRLLSIAAVALLLCARPGAAAEFTSYAFGRGDGSLLIRQRVVWLFGVYFPNDRTTGGGRFRGFVTCEEMGFYDDGSISAVCWQRGADLGANLIRQGLALAGPDAPFEYVALERIAQSNGVGIWGFQVNQFRPVFVLPPGTTRVR